MFYSVMWLVEQSKHFLDSRFIKFSLRYFIVHFIYHSFFPGFIFCILVTISTERHAQGTHAVVVSACHGRKMEKFVWVRDRPEETINPSYKVMTHFHIFASAL